MHRTDADAHVSNQFSDGDAGIGQPGTRVDAAWLNAVQEELAHAIEAAGITLVKGTNTQLAAAIAARFPAVTWITASLLTGWSASVGLRTPLAYWKDAAGIVHLRGAAKADGSSAVVAQLPAGYRPAGSILTVPIFDVTNGLSVYGKIDYVQGNLLVPQSGLPGADVIYCMDAVSFVAEQ